MPADLRSLVPRLAGLRVLVVGDIILDHFVRGRASRISPEAPVPVVNVHQEEYLLGGAANVLGNIVALGGRAELCGLIGDDAMGDRLLALLAGPGGAGPGLVRADRPTTVKTRVLAQGQQIARIDREETGPPPASALDRMLACLENDIARFDAVLVSDYAKGVVGESAMQALRRGLDRARRETGRPIPWVIDPKPVNMAHFAGATVITPNHHEAARMAQLPIRGEENLQAAARTIRDELSCGAVLITRGEAGMALLEGDGPETSLTLIPTEAREVFDVTGAGDTVAATLALGLAAGLDMRAAARLANHAAGIVVGKVGTAAVGAAELARALPAG